MSDQLVIAGKEYVSSKRASELSGYAQDYIGQLARNAQIDARRIGGLWYVDMDSLLGHKKKADEYVPQIPEKGQHPQLESVVSFDGKEYISATRAASITGYHADYVGQLARGGTVPSRQVGNRWYVDRERIAAHKQEKDRLLAAVQAESVGIPRYLKDAEKEALKDLETSFTYTSVEKDPLPVFNTPETPAEVLVPNEAIEKEPDRTHVIPIRKDRVQSIPDLASTNLPKQRLQRVRTPGKTIQYAAIAKMVAGTLTVVLMLSFGFAALKDRTSYAGEQTGPKGNALIAAAAETFRGIAYFFDQLFTVELVYQRWE